MAKIGVNVKLDAQLKAEFEAFCSQLGMTMTDAFTLFATKVVRDWQVPFALARTPLHVVLSARPEICPSSCWDKAF